MLFITSSFITSAKTFSIEYSFRYVGIRNRVCFFVLGIGFPARVFFLASWRFRKQIFCFFGFCYLNEWQAGGCEFSCNFFNYKTCKQNPGEIHIEYSPKKFPALMNGQFGTKGEFRIWGVLLNFFLRCVIDYRWLEMGIFFGGYEWVVRLFEYHHWDLKVCYKMRTRCRFPSTLNPRNVFIKL